MRHKEKLKMSSTQTGSGSSPFISSHHSKSQSSLVPESSILRSHYHHNYHHEITRCLSNQFSLTSTIIVRVGPTLLLALLVVALPIMLADTASTSKPNSTETLIRDILLNQSSAWYDEAAIQKWIEKETEKSDAVLQNETQLSKSKRAAENKEPYAELLANVKKSNNTELFRMLQQKIANFSAAYNKTGGGGATSGDGGFNYTTYIGNYSNYTTTNYSTYASKPPSSSSSSPGPDSSSTAKRSIAETEQLPLSLPIIADNGAAAAAAAAAAEQSAINEFPPDFMSDKVRQNGGFVVHILIFIYLSMALAVICDSYFLKSLEYISEALSLPADIAGATFMAIGTSAPELFTSVIGVFISDNDIGTGTIVGSAVFNLIAIPSACGFAAYLNLKEMPKISSFPIVRDTIFYVLTIITLILCIKDNKVDWIESLTLLALYCVYIVVMYFNAQVAHLIVSSEVKLFSRSSSSESVSGKNVQTFTHNSGSGGGHGSKEAREKRRSSAQNDQFDERRPLLLEAGSTKRSSPPPAYQATGCTYHTAGQQETSDVETKKSIPLNDEDNTTQHFPVDPSQIQLVMGENGKLKEAKLSLYPKASSLNDLSADQLGSMDCICYTPENKSKLGHGTGRDYDGDDELDLAAKQKRKTKQTQDAELDLEEEEEEDDWTDNIVIQVLLFPFRILFLFTLPRPTRFCYVLTFIGSICWIAILTYVIVWMVTLVGYTFGVPDTVSGITVLAAGTSIPELISSYLIVKKAGLADMAICNSIGSNIFDILFCLGLPWLLKTFIVIVTNGFGFATLAASSIPIQSTALPLTSLTLLLTIAAMLTIFKITRWRLCLQTGILCLIVYIIFVVTSTLLEYNV